MKVKVGVSNHHVHLTKETFEILFGKNAILHKKYDLKQKGQYSCLETVTLKTSKAIIENVRLIGPLRAYNQVEILSSDAKLLGINPPIRNSGDLANSESITIIGPNGQINLENGCIIANRHIHINSRAKCKYQDGNIVKVKTKDNIIIDNVHIKKDDTFSLQMHIDKDEASLFNLKNDDIVEILGR